MLRLIFESSDDHVREISPYMFHLYEQNGFYRLPDAVLQTDPGIHTVELQEIRVLPAEHSRLVHELAGSWNHAAGRTRTWVVARMVLAKELELPTAKVGWSWPSGDSIQTAVIWHYVFTDSSGAPATREARVRLIFAPPGAKPAPHQGATPTAQPAAQETRAQPYREFTETVPGGPTQVPVQPRTPPPAEEPRAGANVFHRLVDRLGEPERVRAQPSTAPSAETPPIGADVSLGGADRNTKPEKARVRSRTGSLYNGFASVDFGTSSSTVALLDTRYSTKLALDPAQLTRLRSEFAELLRRRPPAHLAAEWQDHLGKLVDAVKLRAVEFTGGGAAELADRLEKTAAIDRDTESPRDPLLDGVCVAFDERVAECGPELARWLAPQLLNCYDKAFAVPNLFELSIFQVILDTNRKQYAVPSTVEIVEENPIEIRLGNDGPDIRRGLKAALLKPERLPGMTWIDGREATTNDLIVHVYKQLIDRTERFARRDPETPLESIVQLVVTYPTTTPPPARAELERMLGESLDLDRVVVEYDEGVAAGLFFLMRDFGSDRGEFGAEALIARSRRVSDNPPSWRQNMLVIDIGAGTTDIALIRLTLTDVTPAPRDPAGDPLVRGRFYVIRPEVLNSTGHPQLGGDYLTLRIFYWLKAAVLDAMVRGEDLGDRRNTLAHRIDQLMGVSGAHEEPLAPQVAESGMTEPVPAKLGTLMRLLLPTHWEDDASSADKQAFHLLWKLAEAAKIELGKAVDDYHVIPLADLQPVIAAVDQHNRGREPSLLDLLPKEGVRLSRAEFDTLAYKVLNRAVGIGGWLVRTSFRDDPTERLDRVMLSGQTSKMALMRQVVADELGGDDESGASLLWNPSAVTIEAAYAKQAASLGACWAQSIRERGMGVEDAESELAKGKTQVRIAVDNLFHTLPCGFELKQHGSSQNIPLLKAGTPMVEVDDAGTIAVRSSWRSLLPTHEVHRPADKLRTIQWGVFRYFTRKEEGFAPDPQIWMPSADGSSDSKIKAQLEVDPALVPYLRLCHGSPHYHVNLTEAEVIDLKQELEPQHWDENSSRLRDLPAQIWVATHADDGSEIAREQVFPAWSPEREREGRYFPEFFHESAALDSAHIVGRISGALPHPAKNGEYTFFLAWKDREQRIGTLRTTGHSGPRARYTATLDCAGRLRIHRGEPPYWAAKSLRDVERYIGSVHKVPMDEGVPDLNPHWNPFTGKH
ncbi:hypothetical protein [Rhizohabitans arisaemae]|uniref:hypothetical protein n=1 Tax=Rhizohabitans arisaemae TaxID=2720610 RepID=UPI0024B24DC0|nr:hypothetical protein [Rhizohabitans arisaemae]